MEIRREMLSEIFIDVGGVYNYLRVSAVMEGKDKG